MPSSSVACSNYSGLVRSPRALCSGYGPTTSHSHNTHRSTLSRRTGRLDSQFGCLVIISQNFTHSQLKRRQRHSLTSGASYGKPFPFRFYRRLPQTQDSRGLIKAPSTLALLLCCGHSCTAAGHKDGVTFLLMPGLIMHVATLDTYDLAPSGSTAVLQPSNHRARSQGWLLLPLSARNFLGGTLQVDSKPPVAVMSIS